MEMAADAEATPRTGALTLAGALVEMAAVGSPTASLAASSGQFAVGCGAY
ncbi:hypothetical protein OG440_39720 (plasmid) [Streptomyces sp. NBC_00637]